MTPVDQRLLTKTRDEVREALHELCDPVKRGFLRADLAVTTHQSASLLDQLREAVATGRERGARGRGNGLPISVDAHDLLVEIGQRTIWLVQQTGATPAGAAIEPNLREVVAACGLSMDLESILGVRGFLRAWVTGIRNLLDPIQRWALDGYACPQCGAEEAWREDETDGETKRTAALEIVFTGVGSSRTVRGARCLACEDEWEPNQILFLGRLLGCELPNGLTEEGEPAA